jgi:hypothetical protein
MLGLLCYEPSTQCRPYCSIYLFTTTQAQCHSSIYIYIYLPAQARYQTKKKKINTFNPIQSNLHPNRHHTSASHKHSGTHSGTHAQQPFPFPALCTTLHMYSVQPTYTHTLTYKHKPNHVPLQTPCFSTFSFPAQTCS